MIRCEELSKTYAGVERVHEVSFEARPGEVLGIVGPNGAGKSTTLRMVLGLTRPSSGSATIDGRAYRDLPAPLREVGAALDEAGWELALSPLRVLRAWARSNRIPAATVDEVIAVMGLAAVADRPVRQFSLGMRKRVWLALALLGRPRHLIVDEPLNGLDPPSITWLRDLLRRLAAEGTAVVVASHVLAEQERLCDNLVVLAAGRVVSQGSTAELIRQYAPSRTRVEVAPGDASTLGRVVAGLGGSGTGATAWLPGDLRDAVGRGLLAEGVPVLDLTVVSSGLEGAFTKLVGGRQEYGMGAGPVPVLSPRLAVVDAGRLPAPVASGRPRRAA